MGSSSTHALLVMLINRNLVSYERERKVLFAQREKDWVITDWGRDLKITTKRGRYYFRYI